MMNMTPPIVKRLFASIVLALLAAAAWAVPSVEAVQAEVQRGNYVQAEAMMREVVAAKPGSARAHYIFAEVLAHNGRFDQAAQELRQAKQIDPSGKFTDPGKFQAFERLLQRQQEHSRAAAQTANPQAAQAPMAPSYRPAADDRGFHLPGWIWGLGFAALAVIVWRVLAGARRRTVSMMQPAGYGGMAPGYGPMGGVPGAGGGSMLGTGMAAAGGFAAGMLAEKMLDGGMHGHDGSAAQHGYNDGGLQPGMFDGPGRDASADELEHRSIDFGSGDDWGGDAGSFSDGGGSDDGGGW